MSSVTRGLLVLLPMLVTSQLAHAGTTVITHGYAINATQPPVWTLTMAKAILAAAGDPSNCGAIGGATPVGSVFVYAPAVGSWSFYCGSDTPNGEIALVFNWAEESDGADTGGTQGFAEAAVEALLYRMQGPRARLRDPRGFE